MTAPAMSPVICAGPRYPCYLVRPDGWRVQVKALLTNSRAGVPELWAWSGEVHTDGPVPVARVEWLPATSRVPRDGAGTWVVDTVQGVHRVEPGRGGCSRCSSLGRWDPFSPMTYGSMPAGVGSAL